MVVLRQAGSINFFSEWFWGKHQAGVQVRPDSFRDTWGSRWGKPFTRPLVDPFWVG